MNDSQYMQLALALARQGVGYVNPNPMVGAVLVADGQIIGKGFHQAFGTWHAERHALAQLPSTINATLYVTLEPCCHHGKTPPCTELINSFPNITRVVVGTLDPNPIVAGQGVQTLRDAGKEVVVGVLAEQCQELIQIFTKYITTKLPWVLMKYAMTLDGKIATDAGHAQWISNDQSRAEVQELRHALSAIMVGVNTIIQDDPLLTCRRQLGKQPLRIICDTHLRTPLTAQVVLTAQKYPTIIATSCTDSSRYQAYQAAGVRILPIPLYSQHVDLRCLMMQLGKEGIDSVLLEGGGTLNASALQARIVDEVQVYIAPKLIGGHLYLPVTGMGVTFLEEAATLQKVQVRMNGDDLVVTGKVVYPCSQVSLKK